MMRRLVGMFAAVVMLPLSACIGDYTVASKPQQVAARSVQIFERAEDVPVEYEVVDDLSIEYKDNDRDFMLDQLKKLAGQRGADAIILDKNFPRADGFRILPVFSINNSDEFTGATAVRLIYRR